jgi:hypothetical protein
MTEMRTFHRKREAGLRYSCALRADGRRCARRLRPLFSTRSSDNESLARRIANASATT